MLIKECEFYNGREKDRLLSHQYATNEEEFGQKRTRLCEMWWAAPPPCYDTAGDPIKGRILSCLVRVIESFWPGGNGARPVTDLTRFEPFNLSFSPPSKIYVCVLPSTS